MVRQLFTALALICMAGAGLADETAPRADTVDITTGHYPPWTDSKQPGDGVINQLVTAAFATQGLAVNYVHLPWKRALVETRRGKHPASSFWLPGATDDKALLTSEPLLNTRTVFFQRAQDPPISWERLEDLKDYRIGATMGFTYTPAFYDAVDEGLIQVLFVPDESQNFKLLLAGRIDLFAASEFAGLAMARELGIETDRLRIVQPPLLESPVHILFSSDHPRGRQLLESFNRGFRMIRDSGEYQRILERHDLSGSALKSVD